jgi:hypothetical protein
MTQVNGQRRLRIGIDLDDTAVDFHGAFLKFLAGSSTHRLKYDDFFSYSLAEVAGISDAEAQVHYDRFKASSYFADLVPLPGVCESLREIAGLGADFVAITARQPSERETTVACIERCIDTPIHSYRFCKTPNISWADVPRVKAEIAIEEQLDCMVEDSAWNSIVIAEHGVKLFMLPRPWNVKIEHDKIVRCDWPEFPGHLRKYTANGYKWE